MTEWTAFTRIPLKARLYERETYFREGLADAIDVLGRCAIAALQKAALVLIKPDGLASGKASTIVSFLRARGFSIAAIEEPTLNRFHWRELWRYQLTSATLDRLAVNDLFLCDRTLLMLLVHEGDLDVPASVWLSTQKGPSDISAQPPDCLRRLLAQPNRILSFFHVADEPADVLREMAVLLEEPSRRRMMSALSNSTLLSHDQGVLDRALAISDETAKSLDVRHSLRRAEIALREAGNGKAINDIAAQSVVADLERMRRGERIMWRPFVHALQATGTQLDQWDLLMLGAAFIIYDEPGTSKLIKAVDAERWRCG